LVRNGPKTKSGRGRPQAKADEFRQYAEEALRLAHQSKTEKDKEALIDRARMWMQAPWRVKACRRGQSAVHVARQAFRSQNVHVEGDQFRQYIEEDVR
jgi:hypothetical protein